MVCRKCGSSLPDGTTHCTVCGTQQKAGRSFCPGIFWAVVAWILLIGGLIWIFGLQRLVYSDEQLIEKQFSALEEAYNAQDLDKALKCFDLKTRLVSQGLLDRTDELLTEYTPVDLESVLGIAGLFMDRGSFRIQVLQTRVTGDRATAQIRLSVETYGHPHSCKLWVPMMKEGTNWYVGGVIDDLLRLLPKKEAALPAYPQQAIFL